MDLVIRNARLPWGTVQDVGVENGRIAAIAPGLGAAPREIDAGGSLLSLPLVDAHIHLDASLTVPERTTNRSGTLLEGIERWSQIKPDLTVDDVKTRARQAILWEVAQGAGAIRSHVDVCDERLVALRALVQLRAELEPVVDLQLVAFPQEGVMCYPQGQRLMEAAIEAGADVVGGIPHYEWTREDGISQLQWLFALAARHGRLVDVHCDETDDDQSRFVETMARLTAIHGLSGRVTASHVTAMHSYNPAYAFKLRRILAAAGVSVVANPLTNIVLQGRFDEGPVRRGMAPIKALDAAGVQVALGVDCIMDPWYPVGTGSLLRAAWMALHVGHMTGQEEMARVFQMATAHGHAVMRPGAPRELAVGQPADLVVWDATSPVECLRLLPAARWVIRRGNVVAQTQPARREVRVGDAMVPLELVPENGHRSG